MTENLSLAERLPNLKVTKMINNNDKYTIIGDIGDQKAIIVITYHL